MRLKERAQHPPPITGEATTHDQRAEEEQSELMVVIHRRKTRPRPRSSKLLDRLLDLVKTILS